MIRPGEAYSIPFETTVSGVRTAAQSTPTAVLRRNGSASGVSVTVTGSGGLYRGAFTADAGWSEYDRLEMDITADLDAASNYQGIVWDSGSEPIASVTTLESRLTATRAGYIDKLNIAGTLANTDNADDFKAAAVTLSGANTVTITVNDGSSALESARVRVTKGAQSEVKLTNASGQVSFSLDDGTWDVAITLTGYTFASTTIVVDGDETATYSMTALTPTPVSSPWINAQLQCYDAAGNDKIGATVTVTQVGAPSTNGYASEDGPREITSNGDGVAFIPVIPGADYKLVYQTGVGGVVHRLYSVPSTAVEGHNLGSIYG